MTPPSRDNPRGSDLRQFAPDPDLAAGPAALDFGNALAALRLVTRVWYDVLSPAAFVLLMVGLDVSPLRFATIVAAVALFHCGHTLFNDVVDVGVDRASSERSRNRRALVTGAAQRATFLVAGSIMVLASIGLTFLLNWWCVLIAAVSLPLVLAYNFPPLRLAGRPLATQAFWPATWLLIFAYCAAALDFTGWERGFRYAVFVAVFMGLGEGLTQDIRDADNDAAGGRHTTVVHYGVPSTSVAAWLAFAASLMVWAWFLAQRLLPLTFDLAGTAALIGWLAYCSPAITRLQRSYQKADGRLLHIGAIATFTAVNLVVIAGVLVGR
jgi:4-hydroxybenzoate polyprenyltransferase